MADTIVDAPAKPVDQPEQPAKPTAGELTLDQAIGQFGDVFSGRQKKPETEKPAQIKKDDEDKKGTESKDKQGDQKAKDDQKLKEDVEQPHKPKAKSKAPAKPVLDETRMAEIAAEAGARASTEAISRIEKERSKPAEKTIEDFKPPKEYAEKFAAIKVMAKAAPDKYGDLVESFQTFVKEEEGYIKQWKRDHPGEAWNGEDEQHNDFYQRVTPNYDEADMRRAEIKIELGDTRKEIRKEVLDEVEPKLKELDELKRKEVMRELQPVIDKAEVAAMGNILKAINPEYEKFTSPDELVKLKDEDPLAFDVTMAVASDALPFVTEITRLWKGAAQSSNDNPLHKYIFDYATKMQELIKALPAEDQMRDGKKFSTWNDFYKMTPAQQASHWTVTDQDLIERKMLDAQEIARDRIAAEDKRLAGYAKRKGMTQGNANNSLPKQGDQKTEQPAKPLPVKENNGSPSVGSRTQVSPNTTAAPSGQPEWLEQFGNILSGRKV